MRANSQIGSLDECLDRMGVALRMGDFASLAVLAGESEALAEGLAGQAATLTEAEMKALRLKAGRHLGHLAAARDGVRAAMQRVAQLRRLSSELSTYDEAGRGQTIRFAAQMLEHKA